MSTRAAAWLAWSLLALIVVLVVLTRLLDLLMPPRSVEGSALLDVLFTMLVLTYATVGAFVASHRPENPIGWTFCCAGLFFAFEFFADAYANYALVVGASPVPLAEYFAWLSDELALLVVALATVLLLLLFPSGRLPSSLLSPEGWLPSRSWQAVVWMAVGGSAIAAVAAAVQPSGTSLSNPLYISGALGEFLGAVGVVGSLLLFVSALFAAAALISRLTLARGEERQQLKWFSYAAAMMLGGFLVAPLVGIVSGLRLIMNLGYFGGILGFMFLPVATGIAILKYRLYDIDVVINRTLVYGSLTATLVALYLGGIVVLQRIFVALTGEKSTLAVVASTLVIAALFNPLRRRIQSFIDRRFYRRKYDAAKTLAAFNARLRDETDLHTLTDNLVGVVRETMQPEHVSLWLRPDSASKKDEVPG